MVCRGLCINYAGMSFKIVAKWKGRERGKLFSHKFSAMLSLGKTPFWKAVLWVTLSVDDGLFQVCALSLSLENKKEEGAKGHKSPLSSLLLQSPLQSSANL